MANLTLKLRLAIVIFKIKYTVLQNSHTRLYCRECGSHRYINITVGQPTFFTKPDLSAQS